MKSMSRSMVRLILVLGLLAAGSGVYAWWYAQVAGATDRAAALATEINEIRLDSERARDARDQLAALGTDEAAVRAHVVPAQDVVPFLETLEATGASLGSDVEVVSVSAQQEPRPNLALSVRITGGFDAVLRTLGAIEYAPYDIELRQLSLDTAGGSATTTPWVASATLLVGTSATTP
jgi:hypothetical protein